VRQPDQQADLPLQVFRTTAADARYPTSTADLNLANGIDAAAPERLADSGIRPRVQACPG
jgi:hypothetical protein